LPTINEGCFTGLPARLQVQSMLSCGVCHVRGL